MKRDTYTENVRKTRNICSSAEATKKTKTLLRRLCGRLFSTISFKGNQVKNPYKHKRALHSHAFFASSLPFNICKNGEYTRSNKNIGMYMHRPKVRGCWLFSYCLPIQEIAFNKQMPVHSPKAFLSFNYSTMYVSAYFLCTRGYSCVHVRWRRIRKTTYCSQRKLFAFELALRRAMCIFIFVWSRKEMDTWIMA